MILKYIIFSVTFLKGKFKPQKNIFEALASNKGIFDFGFTFTYVGEIPFEFEYYLFIEQHFWRIHKTKDNEREVCIEDLLSDQHLDFNNKKFNYSFSYLSDHMVKHNDELNLTNHLFLQYYERSEHINPDYDYKEINEWIFDANHDNLDYMIGGDFYVFSIPEFEPSVAFQPQSFLENEETDGPNFVFIQQNLTDSGYERRAEVHSVINETVFRNRTNELGQYLPHFIQHLDKQLYINVILHSRLGPGGVDEGIPAVILIIRHENTIKYCVTEENLIDESCKPENLNRLSRCPFHKDEL